MRLKLQHYKPSSTHASELPLSSRAEVLATSQRDERATDKHLVPSPYSWLRSPEGASPNVSSLRIPANDWIHPARSDVHDRLWLRLAKCRARQRLSKLLLIVPVGHQAQAVVKRPIVLLDQSRVDRIGGTCLESQR